MNSSNPYFYSEDLNAIYDIYTLFKYYNEFFFDGILEKCTIEWSAKMTLCAGTCENKGFGSCSIKLSEPLLKLRTPNQLKETILHEMIHAYLFITNPKACLTEGGHGKEFKDIMHNINQITKLKVTIYHNFIDEVDSYRTHIWRCNGICRQKAPFYGYVKRSMNRKPQPADSWWKDHQRYCGGEFIKISQPEPLNNKKKTLKNGKTLKTNTQLQKKSSSFSGQGKTLEDYAKQMEKRPKNTSKPKIEIENNFELESWSQVQNVQNQRKSLERGEKQKKERNESKQRQKSKPKKQEKERDSRKITEWFQNKGKTIEEYSKEIEEQKMMSSINFRR